ncbi:MAG: periplasmic heavy metal sensor [Verrucomicrobia bacterium]|jgi:Spy/CpxP family protein refolding chaperone|nr:periplasmic heavy metal sensor [Verrucomicrobiota bacterium]
MKRVSSALILLGIVALVAASAACLSIMLYSNWHKPVPQDAHAWIHTQLNITAEQDLALVPIEKRYHSERNNLEQQLTLANRELAEAILADGRDSERVHAAIEKIHHHMGALQRVTIGHVFEMKEVLTPEQYQKLLNLTANALYNLDSGHAAD